MSSVHQVTTGLSISSWLLHESHLLNSPFTYTDGSDYTSIIEDAPFPAGSTSGDMQCVNISIIDDFAYEKNESFSVHISSEEEVYVPDPYVGVVIADDEGEWYVTLIALHSPVCPLSVHAQQELL